MVRKGKKGKEKDRIQMKGKKRARKGKINSIFGFFTLRGKFGFISMYTVRSILTRQL